MVNWHFIGYCSVFIPPSPRRRDNKAKNIYETINKCRISAIVPATACAVIDCAGESLAFSNLTLFARSRPKPAAIQTSQRSNARDRMELQQTNVRPHAISHHPEIAIKNARAIGFRQPLFLHSVYADDRNPQRLRIREISN